MLTSRLLLPDITFNDKKIYVTPFKMPNYPFGGSYSQVKNHWFKTYCFGIDFHLLFLVSIIRTAGMNMSVEEAKNRKLIRS